MRPGAAACLLLVSLLAGCAGSSSGAPESSSGAPAVGTTSLQAPSWSAGDWWNYTGTGGAFTYVVTAVGGSDYTMATDSAGLAFFDARFDVSTLGAIRKADLAGSQGTTRVEFFHWPLRDNLTWTTTWDGESMGIKAKELGPGKFGMTATHQNGTVYATYTYDNKTSWLTEVDFKDGHGNSAFGFQLQTSGHKFAGNVKHWDLVTAVQIVGDLAQPPPAPGTYEVPLTAFDVYVSATVACTQGTANIGTSPFPYVTGATGVETRGGGAGVQTCPGANTFSGSAGAPKAPAQGGTTENWGWSLYGSGTGSYSFLVLVRTLHIDPVTA